MRLLWETKDHIVDKCSITHIQPIYKLATKLSKIKNQSQRHKSPPKARRKTIQKKKYWKFFTKIYIKEYLIPTPTPKSYNVLIRSRRVITTIKTHKTQNKQNTQKHWTYTYISKLTHSSKSITSPIDNKSTPIYKTNTTKTEHIQIQQHHQWQNTIMNKRHTKVIIGINRLHNIPNFTSKWSPIKTQSNIHN